MFFMVVSVFVWVTAGGVVVRDLLRSALGKSQSQGRTFSRKGKIFRAVLFSLCGLYILALVWSFVEPYYPCLEKVRLTSPKVTEPLRIVQISDTHCDATGRAEARVVEMIRELQPDLILFTGDGVNSDEGIPQFKQLMQQLSHVSPLYGVQGNWEAWFFSDVDTFAGTGMIELTSEAKMVTIRNQKIWITGAAVGGEAGSRRRAGKLPKSAFRIALHHYPVAIQKFDGVVDILLSGDTHGGQIALPLIGPLIKIKRWGGPYYMTGLHTMSSGTHLYVNRGVGMEGGNVPRVRFMAPPEVTLIEIHPEESVAGVNSQATR